MNKKLILNALVENGGPGSGNHAPGQGQGVGKPGSGTSSGFSSKAKEQFKKDAILKRREIVDGKKEKANDALKNKPFDKAKSIVKSYIDSEKEYYSSRESEVLVDDKVEFGKTFILQGIVDSQKMSKALELSNSAEEFRDLNREVSIYQESSVETPGERNGYGGIGINWSAVGTVNPDYASKFSSVLSEAAKSAQEINKKYKGKKFQYGSLD